MKLKCELSVGPTASNNCEKKGKEPGEIGTTLSLSGEVHIDALKDLFSSEEVWGRHLKSLYGKNGNVVVPDFNVIPLGSEFEKVNVSFRGQVLEDERLSFRGGKLKDISLTVQHGERVSFSAKLYIHPEDEQFKNVNKLLRRDLLVDITSASLVPVKLPDQHALELPAKQAEAKKLAEEALPTTAH